MFSDHAPNRNPAEISFAAVDRRLYTKQREEILALAKYYDADSYYVENEGRQVCVMGYGGYTIAYVDRLGRITPNWN